MKYILSVLSAALLSSIAVFAQPVNLTFFGLWVGPGNGEIITKFESTLLIPGGSPDATPINDVQAFWPGMEPDNSGSVFQNVITNQGGGPGEWFLLPYYCCNPANPLTAQMQVYPGDTVKNVYTYDISTNKWYDNWVVTPGTAGNAAGEKPFGGGFIFDPTIDTVTHGAPFTNTILTIELQGLGTWDFGSVLWTNVIVQANTTSTDWCTNGPYDNGNNFTWQATKPVWSQDSQNFTTCYYAMIILESPHI